MVRLLFDQNLSARLVAALDDAYPGSTHVRAAGLTEAADEEVWRHAREHGFTIASKDADFHQLAFVRGAPPKVIWIRSGNCTTATIERLLREANPTIQAFERDAEASFLTLG